MAADAVWALFDAGVLRRRPFDIALAARAAGLSVADLRAAHSRRDARQYRPPARTVGVTPEAHTRWKEGTARGRANGAGRPSRQPGSGDETMVCRTCGNDLPVDQFPMRVDRPGKRRTTCVSCMREASRDRYLSVAKQGALNAARLTFVLNESDGELDLACIHCGQPLVAGDEVEGEAQLHHVDCSPRDRS